VTDYTALANQPPGTYTPEGYDVANTLITVMKTLGANGVNRGAVVNGLKTVDYKGLTKQIKFQPNGEVTEKGIYVYAVQGGKITELGTVDKLVSGTS
jgi:branched-chain amino acid transport system substrate-binding protein